MNSLKNTQSGRIFIVGSGPSLTIETLESLKEEKCFGVCEIARVFDKTEWRPDYVAFFDRNEHSVIPWLQKAADEGIQLFVSDRYKLDITGNVIFLSHWAGGIIDKTKEDISIGIHAFGTVMHPAAQIAIWMGFTEIYFVGCDLGFEKENHHFYKDAVGWYKNNKALTKLRTARVILAHELIKEWAERKGVKVYNATNGGELEVYPRVRLEDVLC